MVDPLFRKRIVEREERIGWRVGGGPLIGMRLWITRSPWRLGAAWVALAGALASGGLAEHPLNWVKLLLLVFLADPGWGSLWTVLAERRRDAWEDSAPIAAPALPYLQPGSPAARLLGWAESDLSLMAAWRLGLPSLFVATLVALILGRMAIIATAVAFALCFIGWITRRLYGQPDAWAQAILTVGLPWALGYLAYAPVTATMVALTVAWALWQWAALGIEQGEWRSWWMLGIAQGTVAVTLAVAHQPVWCAGIVLVSMPTWWMVIGGRATGWTLAALAQAQTWWWLALMMCGLALSGLL